MSPRERLAAAAVAATAGLTRVGRRTRRVRYGSGSSGHGAGVVAHGFDAIAQDAGARAQARDRLLVVLAFAAVYLIWGSTYLALAWGVATIPPLTMIAGRSLLAGGVLYAVSRRSAGRPAAADWRRAIVAGVLLFVTGQAMVAWAETRVASGPAAVLIATEPLFVAMLGWLWRRSAHPTPRTVLALIGGFAGVAVMMLPGRLGGVDALGAFVLVTSALSWSIGMYLATPGANGSPVQAASMQLLAGGMVLVLLAAVTGDLASFDPSAVTTRSLLSFLYLVVFGSLITYSAYVWLLKRVGPGPLSSHGYVNPMVAVALGAALAGEAVTFAVLLASALILASVVVLLRGSR